MKEPQAKGDVKRGVLRSRDLFINRYKTEAVKGWFFKIPKLMK